MVNNEYLETLVRKKGVRKLSLGAGKKKPIGFLSADGERHYQPDVLIDLDGPWYFPKDWFSHILAEHIIEHVRDVPAFMNNCHDILLEGGELQIICPYWAGRWATGDPTHIHLFNQDSFNAWSSWAGNYVHLNGHRCFDLVKFAFMMEPPEITDENLKTLGFTRIVGMDLTLKKVSWR